MPRYIFANQEMLKEIGEKIAWNALDEAAQKELKSEMLQKLTAFHSQNSGKRMGWNPLFCFPTNSILQ